MRWTKPRISEREIFNKPCQVLFTIGAPELGKKRQTSMLMNASVTRTSITWAKAVLNTVPARCRIAGRIRSNRKASSSQESGLRLNAGTPGLSRVEPQVVQHIAFTGLTCSSSHSRPPSLARQVPHHFVPAGHIRRHLRQRINSNHP